MEVSLPLQKICSHALNIVDQILMPPVLVIVIESWSGSAKVFDLLTLKAQTVL